MEFVGVKIGLVGQQICVSLFLQHHHHVLYFCRAPTLHDPSVRSKIHGAFGDIYVQVWSTFVQYMYLKESWTQEMFGNH